MEVSLKDFLEKLSAGEAWVAGPRIPPVTEEAARVLWKMYEADAWHFPGFQPTFEEAVALRAAVWLYAACLCYADRSIGHKEVEQMLQPLHFPEVGAEAHYAADLIFRHAPALHALAGGLDKEDPLLVALVRLGWQWPLSSPGLSMWRQAPAPPDLSVIRSHEGLWRLYLDRVVLNSDRARLADSFTRQAARASLGDHPELAINLYPELISP